MALVNKADGDRDTIDGYMDELESIQERQLSLMGSLREGLDQFNRSRGASRSEQVLDGLSDDDSFEDLRD